MSVKKSVRFEVFKRDSFTCQYCGRKAPDVILECDHIQPVAKGGLDELLNLITSCKDCNSGKSDKLLSQTTVLDKQRAQLEELQERREQIDMMFQWQQSLLEIHDDVVTRLARIWGEQVRGYHLNDSGLKDLKKLAKKYSIDEVVEAIRTAADQYLEYSGELPTKESVELAWGKVGGICRVNRLEKESPDLRRLYYIRGIIRNRFTYCNDGQAMSLLRRSVDCNASIDSLEDFAKTARNWTAWRSGMEEYIASHGPSDPKKDEVDPDA